MSKRVLDGDSNVWVKIDNIHDIRDDQSMLYKPEKSASLRETSLFDEFTCEDDDRHISKKADTSGKIKYIIILITLLLMSIFALYIVYSIF